MRSRKAGLIFNILISLEIVTRVPLIALRAASLHSLIIAYVWKRACATFGCYFKHAGARHALLGQSNDIQCTLCRQSRPFSSLYTTSTGCAGSPCFVHDWRFVESPRTRGSRYQRLLARCPSLLASSSIHVESGEQRTDDASSELGLCSSITSMPLDGNPLRGASGDNQAGDWGRLAYCASRSSPTHDSCASEVAGAEL